MLFETLVSLYIFLLPFSEAPPAAPLPPENQVIETVAEVTPAPVLGISETPTPLPKPIKTPEPTPFPTDPPGFDREDFILGLINKLRTDKGLVAVSETPEVCDFADLRAKELVGSFNHAAFWARVNSGTLPYGSHSKVLENIAVTTDYRKVFPLWKNSQIHFINMTADISFGCIGSYGKFYTFQGLRP
jgi:uncharacterized protein YkwD